MDIGEKFGIRKLIAAYWQPGTLACGMLCRAKHYIPVKLFVDTLQISMDAVAFKTLNIEYRKRAEYFVSQVPADLRPLQTLRLHPSMRRFVAAPYYHLY